MMSLMVIKIVGRRTQTSDDFQNIHGLNPKSICSYLVVRTYVLIAIHLSVGEIKPGGHRGAFS